MYRARGATPAAEAMAGAIFASQINKKGGALACMTLGVRYLEFR